MAKKAPRRQDLAKLGNQFVLIYQASPCLIMPIITKPLDVPGHRTDVQIDPKELYCMKKPDGTLLIKLQETKAVQPDKLTVIGKVSKASLQRIDTAINRERQIIAEEQSHKFHRGRFK